MAYDSKTRKAKSYPMSLTMTTKPGKKPSGKAARKAASRSSYDGKMREVNVSEGPKATPLKKATSPKNADRKSDMKTKTSTTKTKPKTKKKNNTNRAVKRFAKNAGSSK